MLATVSSASLMRGSLSLLRNRRSFSPSTTAIVVSLGNIIFLSFGVSDPCRLSAVPAHESLISVKGPSVTKCVGFLASRMKDAVYPPAESDISCGGERVTLIQRKAPMHGPVRKRTEPERCRDNTQSGIRRPPAVARRLRRFSAQGVGRPDRAGKYREWRLRRRHLAGQSEI